MDALQPIKSGWIYKQGGVIKSWHKRWFVLKGTQMLYYTSNDESKQMGTIRLSGNKITEQMVNPNDPEKFPFEIVAGSDKTRMTLTHETYPMYVCNEEDRKKWIYAIKNALYGSKGGAIFGQPLTEIMQFESQTSSGKVPSIVEKCVAHILENGIDVEGIFRLPGRTILIKQLKESFDCAEQVDFDRPDIDVNSVASLLKLYFRELPEPIIPKKFYEPIMKIVQRDMPLNEQKAMNSLQNLLNHMPKANYNLIQYLCQFLSAISENESKNKMSVNNLATVFVNSVIRPEDEDPALLMGTSNGRARVTFIFITEWQKLFSMEYNVVGDAVKVGTIFDINEESNSISSETLAAESLLSPGAETISDDLLGLELDLELKLPSPLAAVTTELQKDVRDYIFNEDLSPKPVNQLYPDLADFDTKEENTMNTQSSRTVPPPIPSRVAPVVPPKSKHHRRCSVEVPSTYTESNVLKERSHSDAEYVKRQILSKDKSEEQIVNEPHPNMIKRKSFSFSGSLCEATQNDSTVKYLPARPAPPPPPAKLPPVGHDAENNGHCESNVLKVNNCMDTATNMLGANVQPDEDVTVLLNTCVDNYETSQLKSFITALKGTLVQTNILTKQLNATICDMNKSHKKQLNEMAKKLDLEKKATADAVDKVVMLQKQIHDM